jgi:hypothetical protein
MVRRRHVALATAAAALALAAGGQTATAPSWPGQPRASAPQVPGPLERGKWVCSRRSARQTCAGPVTVGVRYLYVLRTHCGILDAYFGGRLWHASPALSDGSGNPPRGWENPESLGTMRLVGTNVAEYRQSPKLVARFAPAPPHWQARTCD